MKIIKRNGSTVDFDKNKIINAILKSFEEVDGLIADYARQKAENIAEYIHNVAASAENPLTVEEIQDYVENGLMATKRKDVARAYVRYRYKKEVAREVKQDFFSAIGKDLRAEEVDNQNANVDGYSFGGRVGAASSTMTKEYALNFLLSKTAKNNHLNNEVYTHDLDHYAIGDHNCLTIPIDSLAKNGAIVRGSKILRPCKSITSFCELSAVYKQLQSLEQFGGVSYSHYDWSAVPYVRMSFVKHYVKELKHCYGEVVDKEQMKQWTNASIGDKFLFDKEKAYIYAMEDLEEEVHQAIEGLYHNLNTLQSRSGNQLPFSSINYGTCTLPEGRMIIKALLECSLEGIGEKHTTSIFPCGIFQLMRGVNREPGDPNYDLYQLALKSTAKRLYPNYANVDWSGNAGYDRNDPRTYFSTMGCRTANGADINALPGQNPQLKDGRGNICPVTIILPTLAMEAEQLAELNYRDHQVSKQAWMERAFFTLLDQKIHEAKDQLIERFEWICSQSPDSAKFMYQNHTMYGYVPEEGIRSALKHGTLAIGQLGLAETLQILVGCDHTEEKGMKLAKKIEQLFKDRCAEFKQEYRLNFGVYFTPKQTRIGRRTSDCM